MKKKLLFFLLLFSFSCSGVRQARKIQTYLTSESIDHQIRSSSSNTLEITYTGCGGFLLQDNTSAILLDPYFSNISPLIAVRIKKMKVNTKQIDTFFKEAFQDTLDQDGVVKAIVIAHSHYDHLADIPTIFKRNCNQDSTEILCSKTTKHILKGAGITKEVQSIDSTPEFYYTKDRKIRILPIASEHAPHLCGMKFLPAKKIDKDYKRFPRMAGKLPEGENYNFLIDFLAENGMVKFRVFSHAGAACNDPIGLPSEEQLEEKGVDVLLLCVASFNQVENYPEGVIRSIQPKHIIGNHWENFFRPYEKNLHQAATVPGTNVKKFISRLNQQLLELGVQDSTKFELPFPGTTLHFSY